MTKNFISYLRVSTTRQGQSGLGLDAQQHAITTYLNTHRHADLLRSFTEVESGRKVDRPKLDEALIECRIHNAILVVAKVDRLTRSSYFLHKILNPGVEVAFCDLPQISGPTGEFMLNQMAAVAQLEAGLISQRTKAALAAAKARGVRLGGDRGSLQIHYRKGIKASVKVRSDKADRRAKDLSLTIKNMGDISAGQIAKNLNSSNIKTARGGKWQTIQVIRVLKRIEAIQVV